MPKNSSTYTSNLSASNIANNLDNTGHNDIHHSHDSNIIRLLCPCWLIQLLNPLTPSQQSSAVSPFHTSQQTIWHHHNTANNTNNNLLIVAQDLDDVVVLLTGEFRGNGFEHLHCLMFWKEYSLLKYILYRWLEKEEYKNWFGLNVI